MAATLLAFNAGSFAQEAAQNSVMDAPLFYQLLIGEMELSAGRAGNAYEVILDAAKRHNDPSLFQRAVEIALQARAGDQALAAARAWRRAVPDSADALRFQAQILLALNRPNDMVEYLAQPRRDSPNPAAQFEAGAIPGKQHAAALSCRLKEGNVRRCFFQPRQNIRKPGAQRIDVEGRDLHGVC